MVIVHPHLWKGSLVALAAYALAIIIGLALGLRYTLGLIPLFQVLWTVFCLIRIAQLRRSGGNRAGAIEADRQSYGFSLGGLISSATLFLLTVVATQVV